MSTSESLPDEPRAPVPAASNASATTDQQPWIQSPRSSSASLGSETGAPVAHHRASIADSFRNHPPSPRSQRHPSFTQAAVAELLSYPPHKNNSKFAGRSWAQITVGELVNPQSAKLVDFDTSVEDATKLLIEQGAPNVILIRDEENPNAAVSAFDYSDLNTYLLAVIGLAHPSADEVETYDEIARKTRERNPVSLREAKKICRHEPLILVPESQTLPQAIEAFGSGVHRLVVVKENTKDVIGILSQLKVLDFFWENGTSFPGIDNLFPTCLKDLSIGSRQIIGVNGDKPVVEALQLMHNEALTSVAVVDNNLNVIGNISTVDTKNLTRETSFPLLQSPCSHFISVILSERGVEMGKDSFPVFHVNPYSTLAHTVAKLVATRSHRMWIVDPASPSPSAPATPSALPNVFVGAHGSSPASPLLSATFPSSGVPGTRVSGRLTGVVSLTDILNLFARQSGLNPAEPNAQREFRRRSSSSSVRPSMESLSRSSFDLRR